MPSANVVGSGGLRSRKIDFKKNMQVFKYTDVDDIVESVEHRLLPVVSTGVEKEEEQEHHLQVALNYSAAVIPTPEASKSVDDYGYAANFNLPKSLICFSSMLEDVIGCEYNCSKDELDWINSKVADCPELNPDDFEKAIHLMDVFGDEKLGSEPPSYDQVKEFFSESNHSPSEALFKIVYDYWIDQRYTCSKGRLRYILKGEEMSDKPDSDPYVCFRRREIKSLRKGRRGDMLALEKLKQLKDDMLRVKEILDLVHEREVIRNDILDMDQMIMEKRIVVRRLKRILNVNTPDIMTSQEKAPKRSHRSTVDGNSESNKIRIPLHKLRDAASIVSEIDMASYLENMSSSQTLNIEDQIKKMKYQDERDGWLDLSENPMIPASDRKGQWMESSSYDKNLKCYINRRRGRGGRIVFDRSYSRDQIDQKKQSEAVDNLARVVGYRSFSLAPEEEQYRHLMNKPHYPSQIHPQLSPRGYRYKPPLVPPQVVRTPIVAVPAATPTPKKQRNQKNNNSVVKKEIVDPRTAAVKALMQQSQRQAQQNQAQMQTGNSPKSANAATPNMMEDLSLQGSPNLGQMQLNAFQIEQLKFNMVQQAAKMQMFQQVSNQMPNQFMNQMQAVANPLMGQNLMTPQQLQQMYFSQNLNSLQHQVAMQNQARANSMMFMQNGPMAQQISALSSRFPKVKQDEVPLSEPLKTNSDKENELLQQD